MPVEPELSLPPEPVLAVGEIQGNVLPGFRARRQSLLFLEVREPVSAASWLASIAVTTLADVLAAREGRGRPRPGATRPWRNVAFSFEGLQKLFPDAGRLTDAALKQGLPARSRLLGDPVGEHEDGDCRNWVVGAPEQAVDVLLILADDDGDAVEAEARSLRRRPPAGTRLVAEHRGGELPAPLAGREPFGFCDDISQPGVRGRLTPAADDFLTPRDGKGRNLVWPGEFVYGYPTQHALDKVRPGPIAQGGPPWTANGSLLVFRRLRQDVAAFHEFAQEAAAQLRSRHPGLDRERLVAKLMGRWPSGAPLVRSPDADAPELAGANDFTYVGGPDADPVGLACPRAAHVRRAYPRDAATSAMTEANIETHRLLRRSVPYVDEEERGLLFLAYQSSIERQFEFVTRAWLNNPHVHDTDDGEDPIVGQRVGGRGDRTRMFALPVRGGDGRVDRVLLRLPRDWVTPRGGGYFFVPSRSALASLGR